MAHRAPSTAQMTFNVWLAMAFTGGYYSAQGIWGMVILGPLLFEITKSNTFVGIAEAIQGTAQLLVALPAGFLADALPRTTVLRVAAVAGVAAAAVSCFAVKWYPSFVLLSVGLGLIGVYKGIWNPPLQAIFADSVQEGQRSRFFTLKFIVLVLSTASGPLLSIFLFRWFGDQWTYSELSTVFFLGMAISVPVSLMLCFFKDVDPLKTEEQGLLAGNAEQAAAAPRPELVKLSYRLNLGFFPLRVSQDNIPAIVAISDLVSGLASGMTIKFFPLFFEMESGMSPIVVSIIYVIAPVFTAVSSSACQLIGMRLGRIHIVIIVRIIGVALLVIMALMKSFWQQFWIITPIYVFRTALMNSTLPLVRSAVMDYSLPENRAKWSSLESMTSFGWSGSAMLGGFLADRYGYGGTFLGTAALQLLSTIIISFTLPLVPVEKTHAEVVEEYKSIPQCDEEVISLSEDDDASTQDPIPVAQKPTVEDA